jgi:hypothetical protein
MQKRTVAALSLATVVLWAVIKWIADQIAGNFVADYIVGLLPKAGWSQMTAATVASGIFLGIALLIVLGSYGLGAWDKKQANTKGTATGSGAQSENLSHTLHLNGMNVIVDQRKKLVQIGFRLKNAATIPLRYVVRDMSVAIDGKTAMSPKFDNPGGVVAVGAESTYFFPAIPKIIGKKDAVSEASILFRYGPAGPDEPPVREANYRVHLTIGPKSHHYLVLEENDGAV